MGKETSDKNETNENQKAKNFDMGEAQFKALLINGNSLWKQAISLANC